MTPGGKKMWLIRIGKAHKRNSYNDHTSVLLSVWNTHQLPFSSTHWNDAILGWQMGTHWSIPKYIYLGFLLLSIIFINGVFLQIDQFWDFVFEKNIHELCLITTSAYLGLLFIEPYIYEWFLITILPISDFFVQLKHIHFWNLFYWIKNYEYPI